MSSGNFGFMRVAKVLILFALTLSACNNDLDENNMTFLDLGIMNHYGNDYLIITDAGVVLLTSSLPTEIDFEDNVRVSVKYHVLSGMEPTDSIKIDYRVAVDAIDEVLTKEIITINDENRDTLGSAPVKFQDVWITQDFLTVYFSFLAGNKDHYFNLTYDPKEQSDPDVVNLTFRHEDNGDIRQTQYSGFISFRLNSLRQEGKSTINITFKGKQYNSDEGYTADLVYTY